MLKEWIWYLITLPFRLYFLTWVFILILFKRRVPQWLQDKAKKEVSPDIPLGKPEPYKK